MRKLVGSRARGPTTSQQRGKQPVIKRSYLANCFPPCLVTWINLKTFCCFRWFRCLYRIQYQRLLRWGQSNLLTPYGIPRGCNSVMSTLQHHGDDVKCYATCIQPCWYLMCTFMKCTCLSSVWKCQSTFIFLAWSAPLGYFGFPINDVGSLYRIQKLMQSADARKTRGRCNLVTP